MSNAGFWLRWVAANAVGELLGLGPAAAVGILLARVLVETGGIVAALASLLLFTLLGALEGAIVGLAQRMVLHRRLPGVTRRSWVAATAAGAAAAWFLGMLPATAMSLLQDAHAGSPEADGAWGLAMAAGMGLALGMVLATPQWLVLRRFVDRAGWWLPANAVAWAVAMPLVFLASGLPLPQDGLVPLLAAVLAVIAGAGALVGAIHGAVLVRITGPGRARRSA